MALTITPEEATGAADALAAAAKAQSVTDANQIETQAGQLAPGLATGTNAVGGYNNLRTIAPVAQPLADNMVLATKQGVFKLAMQKAQNDAKVAYDGAQAAYQDRQQDYYRRQAEESRRQAAAAASAAYGSGTGSGSTVSDVGVTTTSSYKMASNGKGGYNFFDPSGKAITWQEYDKQTGRNSSALVKGTAGPAPSAPKAAAPAAKGQPVRVPAPMGFAYNSKGLLVPSFGAR